MNMILKDRKVAIVAADGFEQSELEGPLKALESAGAEVRIVSTKSGQITGMHHMDHGSPIDVDLTLEDADPSAFDALVIPGGLYSPDALRSNPEAIRFVRGISESGKPIGAICHGPWLLIEAGIVDGRKLTSWPAIRTDVVNAGGNWVDEEVVVDNGLVTSRRPADIPAFSRKIIEEFAEGVHA
jgi:protease I